MEPTIIKLDLKKLRKKTRKVYAPRERVYIDRTIYNRKKDNYCSSFSAEV